MTDGSDGSGAVRNFPPLLDAKDCAAVLKISGSMFYKLMKKPGAPKPILIGSLRRWSHQGLMEWLERLAENENSEDKANGKKRL